jgi:peptidoglycan/xylan/chitin deacetylase (PgdA/CDA1 family)
MSGDLLILCYHAVSEDWAADLAVTPAAITAQLKALQRRGYRGLTLDQAMVAQGRRFVASFDDGYLSNLTLAAPLLARLGVPGTLFVPTDHIGTGAPMSWPGIDQWLDGPHRDELLPLDWDGVRELDGAGWQIGSHTCSHPKLTRLGDAELIRELRDSRMVVERELRKPCRSIAYPYGDLDDRVAHAAGAAGYELGVGLPDHWRDSTDPLQLPRVGVYHGQAGLKLALKLSPTVRRARIRLAR